MDTVGRRSARRVGLLLAILVMSITACSSAADPSDAADPTSSDGRSTELAGGDASELGSDAGVDPVSTAAAIEVATSQLGRIGDLDWTLVELPGEWLSLSSFGSPDGRIIMANEHGVRVTADGSTWSEIDLPTYSGEGAPVVVAGTNSSQPGQFHLTLRTEVSAGSDADPDRCTDEQLNHRWRLASFADGDWTSRVLEETTAHAWNTPFVWDLAVVDDSDETLVIHTRGVPTTRIACLFPEYDSGQEQPLFDELTEEGIVIAGQLQTWEELGVPAAALDGVAALRGEPPTSMVLSASTPDEALIEVLRVSEKLRTDGAQLYSVRRGQLSSDLGETWTDVVDPIQFSLEVFEAWRAPWRLPVRSTFTNGVSGPLRHSMWIDGGWVSAPSDEGEFDVRPTSVVGDVVLGNWNDAAPVAGVMPSQAPLEVPNYSIATSTGDGWYRFDPAQVIPEATSLRTIGTSFDILLVADWNSLRWNADGRVLTDGPVLVAVGRPPG